MKSVLYAALVLFCFSFVLCEDRSVGTAKELKKALQSSKALTIQVTEDITLDLKKEKYDVKDKIVLGNGHRVQIKNGVVAAQDSTFEGIWFKDCLNKDGQGDCIRAAGDVTLKQCTLENADDELLIIIDQANVVADGCRFKHHKSEYESEADKSVIMRDTSYGSTMTISNSIFTDVSHISVKMSEEHVDSPNTLHVHHCYFEKFDGEYAKFGGANSYFQYNVYETLGKSASSYQFRWDSIGSEACVYSRKEFYFKDSKCKQIQPSVTSLDDEFWNGESRCKQNDDDPATRPQGVTFPPVTADTCANIKSTALNAGAPGSF